MARFNVIAVALAALLFAVVLPLLPVWVSALQNHFADTPGWHGLEVQRPLPALDLGRTAAGAVTLDDLSGQPFLLMFGFLDCQQVCHTQALLMRQLAEAQRQVRMVYVVMDPGLDTRARLATYFSSTQEPLLVWPRDRTHAQQLAHALGAPFHYNPNATPHIEHPGYLFLVDNELNLRVVYTSSQIHMLELLADFERLQRTVI